MKRGIRRIAAIIVGLAMMVGCGGGGSSSGGSNSGDFSSGGGSLERTAIDGYLNDFLIPTLSSLDSSAGALLSACRDLVSAPSEAALQTARQAWVAARVPWERSETALFGPVDFYGFDPALDTWPVNQADLEGVIGSGSQLNSSTVSTLDNALKGFHTIEYLLYGTDGSKQASSLTTREGEYLVATAQALKGVTSDLLAAWVDGFAGQAAYALEVTRAGQGSAVFPTEASALEQLVRGMVTICDEVANGKIADPFDQRNPNIVESQFSGNSLTDFTYNIQGARMAYAASVSVLVRAEDPGLDTEVLAAFDQAIAAVQSIPEPFLTAIQNRSNDSVIVAAQRSVRAVQTLLEGEVLNMVLS